MYASVMSYKDRGVWYYFKDCIYYVSCSQLEKIVAKYCKNNVLFDLEMI